MSETTRVGFGSRVAGSMAGVPGGRGRGIAAAIEGFFAAGWFSWGGSYTTGLLSTLSTVASFIALLMAVAGVVLAIRSRAGGDDPMADAGVRRRYWIIVGIEFGVAFIGAAILGALGLQLWIAVLISAIVGLHFIPLGTAFGDQFLRLIGALMVVVAVVALVLGLTTGVNPTVAACLPTGVLLIIAGVASLGGLRVPDRS